MLQTLARPMAAALPPPAGIGPGPKRGQALAEPVLRLRRVPVGDTTTNGRCLNLDAWPGELIHLGGGSAAQRHQLLRVAAGLASPPSGQCLLLGRSTGSAAGGIPHALRWPPAMLGHVLHDDSLPTRLPVPDFVAEPLLADGLDVHAARNRAELELYLLGAAGLRQRQPESLSLLEARQVRLARATVTRPALLVLAWPDRGLQADAARALRLALTTLACTFGSCVLLTSDNPRLTASADRHIDLDRLG